ncbi:MAG: Fur family transcriptional regulator [Candidatus Gracilibacteria bacterium]|nr:Fur family transcriptional regulator [Candidatus Gracilibacteria bacterium]
MNQYLTLLRSKGFRITKARKSTLDYLMKQNCALSVKEVHQFLCDEGLSTDLSTVYREMQFLHEQHIVREVVFKDTLMRYELDSPHHHHHLICTACDKVELVHMEEALHELEQGILKDQNFSVTSHMLEFYGLCSLCHC